MVKYQEIFVPGGFPHHTYNPRVELQLEEKLIEVKNNLCKLLPVQAMQNPVRPSWCVRYSRIKRPSGLIEDLWLGRTTFGTT